MIYFLKTVKLLIVLTNGPYTYLKRPITFMVLLIVHWNMVYVHHANWTFISFKWREWTVNHDLIFNLKFSKSSHFLLMMICNTCRNVFNKKNVHLIVVFYSNSTILVTITQYKIETTTEIAELVQKQWCRRGRTDARWHSRYVGRQILPNN